VYGRLRPGVTLVQAQADVDRFVQGLRARFPTRYNDVSGFRVTVVPVQEEVVGPLRAGLTLVSAAVGALLLVAATNVAGLLLARAAGRRRETSLRAALGASRGRIAREVLAEAVVLAGLAGGAGLLVARAVAALLDRVDPVTLPRAQPIAVDARVAGFALLATFLTALVSGGVPAWQVSRSDLMHALRTGLQGTGGRQATRSRRGLIVVQTAVALALLAGAGLLVRSLAELQEVAAGFRGSNVLVAQVMLPRSRYADGPARARLVDEVTTRAADGAGVLAAGAVSELPLSGSGNSSSLEIEGRPVPPGRKEPHAETWSASPGYFRALAIPVRRGRAFDARDGDGAAGVAIVNETFARVYFPGEDPLGRRIDFEGDAGHPRWREIVGVVGDVRDRALDREPGPQLYTPYAQRRTSGLFLVVRTAGDARSALPVLRAAVHAADEGLPLFDVTTMERLVEDDTQGRRAAGTALAGFAAAAVALAALGLYGLLAQTVRERVPEIGVRLALGARRRDVARLFLADGARLALLGLGTGTVAALAGTRLLGGFLYGVTATDPGTYVAVALLLGAVSLAACALPAWRAARVDPVRALRSE
jgi:putative ABC transport system permease protein